MKTLLFVQDNISPEQTLEIEEDCPACKHKNRVYMNCGQIIGAFARVLQRGHHQVVKNGGHIRLQKPYISQVAITFETIQ